MALSAIKKQFWIATASGVSAESTLLMEDSGSFLMEDSGSILTE